MAAQHAEIKTGHQTASQLARSEIDRLGAALTQARLEKETAQQQQRALQTQLERQSSDQGEHHARLASLQKELQIVRGEAEAERQRLTQALSEERTKAAAERQRFQEELVTAQRQLDRDRQSLESELEEFRQQIASMRDTLSNLGIHV